MGTRNLTAVYMDGEYRVAQYGQWDGYPEGQGLTCLHFLQEMDESVFRKAIENVKYYDIDTIKAIGEEFGTKEDGCISIENYNALCSSYPALSRDTASEILQMIYDGSVKFLKNDLSFAADSLYCEWAYVIDLDKRTFEAYEGFNEIPLTEKDRFHFLRDKEEGKYRCIRLAHEWSLDNLPCDEDFISALCKNE